MVHRVKGSGLEQVASDVVFSEEFKKLVSLSSEVQLYKLLKEYQISSMKEDESI